MQRETSCQGILGVTALLMRRKSHCLTVLNRRDYYHERLEIYKSTLTIFKVLDTSIIVVLTGGKLIVALARKVGKRMSMCIPATMKVLNVTK